MNNDMHWKQVGRKKVFGSKFVTVYEDTVQLPGGQVLNDYAVIQLFDVVTVVATDVHGHLLCLREYKYPLDKTILTLPAGHIEKGEDVIAAAKRELLEETGYGEGVFTLIGEFNEYPTKNLHKIIVIRATDVIRIADEKHESTEFINEVQRVPREKIHTSEIYKQFTTSSMLAAVALAGLL